MTAEPAQPGPAGHAGAALQGQAAGIVTRSLAVVIDALVTVAITAALWGAVVGIRFISHPARFTVPSPTMRFATISLCLVAVAYLTVGWALVGRTSGAQVLGLLVLRTDGRRVGWVRSLARAALCVVFPVGLAWCAVSRSSRSVADLILGTRVVHDWGHRSVRPAGRVEP
jgi:uncharacterized RDD family membrane protein YckC